MINRSILILCIFLTLPTFVQARMSDVSCDDKIRMTETLRKVMGAERQGMGLRDPETTLEIWVTQRNGDWIIVQNYTNRTSCIVAMGKHWEDEIPGPA